MQTTFKTTHGNIRVPSYFAVYHLKNGKTIKRVQDELLEDDLSRYEGVKKVELFKNGTENTSPVQMDQLVKA